MEFVQFPWKVVVDEKTRSVTITHLLPEGVSQAGPCLVPVQVLIEIGRALEAIAK